MSDFQDDKMDALLRQSMRQPAPRLPSEFDRQLARRMKPRTLDRRGRKILAVYAVAAALLSAWALAPLPVWVSGIASVVTIVTLAIFWTTARRRA
jgi:hypothetical protein